jgi:N-carbamoyl-L-amino-acid hydrolase
MHLRRDASLGAAGVVAAVNAIPDEIEGALTTTGVIEAHPNSRNVVPSRVFLTVDLRHTEEEKLESMEARLETIVAEVAGRERLDARLERIWDSPPVRFDPDCIEAVRRAARASGHPHRSMVSGAGHDAVYVARAIPTAMIFVPCKDGISHNEIESADPAHVEAGASVLLQAVLERDRAR